MKDSSGAVIPDAVISVVNTETNVARSATANAEGIYVITNLIPGSYKLSATFQGFKNLEQGRSRFAWATASRWTSPWRWDRRRSASA